MQWDYLDLWIIDNWLGPPVLPNIDNELLILLQLLKLKLSLVFSFIKQIILFFHIPIFIFPFPWGLESFLLKIYKAKKKWIHLIIISSLQNIWTIWVNDVWKWIKKGSRVLWWFVLSDSTCGETATSLIGF